MLHYTRSQPLNQAVPWHYCPPNWTMFGLRLEMLEEHFDVAYGDQL